MSTAPSSPPPAEPHRARQAAESFGVDAERYDRTRPRYPQALIDWIIANVPGRDVLDVGIGTGVSARPFRAAGCRVLGVEVDARMAAFARHDGFDVEVAAFEDWDPAGRMFDLVVAGMTWHNRILSRSADEIRALDAFAEPRCWRVDWEQRYTTDQWLDQVPTFGGHSRFAPAKLAELIDGIGAAIDAIGGSFTMRYAAVAVAAKRLPIRHSTSRPGSGSTSTSLW